MFRGHGSILLDARALATDLCCPRPLPSLPAVEMVPAARDSRSLHTL